jgi:hypothetical protein
LLSGREPGKGGLFADVLTQARNVLDRHEDSMAVRILELKILSRGPIGCFEQLGSGIPAEAMGRVKHELTGIEGGSELRWQLVLVYPPLVGFKHGGSWNVGGDRPASCATRGAGAGDGDERDGKEVDERQPLAQKEKARRRAHRRLEAHQNAEDLARQAP